MENFNSRTIFLSVVLACLFYACATTPLGRNQLALLSDHQMSQMGAVAFQNQKKKIPVSKNRRINRFVRCVGNRLTGQVGGNWEVVVFNESKPNAFALPGGKIGVHTGLLSVAQNQHQLATVIGHEIAHVVAKHSNERVSQQLLLEQGLSLGQALAGTASSGSRILMGALGLGAQYGIILPYGRAQESEADLIGLDLMAKAGFDPRESIALWKNMGKVGGPQTAEFLSTHPSHGTRILDLKKRMPTALKLRKQAQKHGTYPQC